jgi:hypothetical protein
MAAADIIGRSATTTASIIEQTGLADTCTAGADMLAAVLETATAIDLQGLLWSMITLAGEFGIAIGYGGEFDIDLGWLGEFQIDVDRAGTFEAELAIAGEFNVITSLEGSA